ncbi:MAG TPA: DUF4956 domain-containing protein [Gemmatimonadales bacterium]|jgi:hypothetical protein|nr:DUF4956 domain-containing protein [Gemmatimonadales bacterium]
MNVSRTTGTLNRLAESPIARVIAYYIVLFAGTAVFVELVPGAEYLVSGGVQQSVAEVDAGVRGMVTGGGQVPVISGPSGFPISEVFAMASAFALMLPVTWIYIMTRRRKGFRQSVVQTLVILPVVVAGVVFLVKNSLALAFSLGGIVAAVSFRNTLRDTKDAVYIFLATGVGLAAGIQSVPFAAALSITFNIVILLLWWTDFGRAPAHLQGPPAQRRLQRALAMANRTSAFVAQVDEQILKSLTPEQLDALAERTKRRRARSADGADVLEPVKRPVEFRRLELKVLGPVDPARRAAESVLESSAKRWEFVRAAPAPGGGEILEYKVRLKKSISSDALLQSLRTGAAPHVTSVQLG